MKKVLIAGMLATVMTGSGLTALLLNQEAAAAPAATNAPQPKPASQQPPAKQRPAQDGECRSADAPRKAEGPARSNSSGNSNNSSSNTSETVQGAYTVTLSGGFETDPQDHGRPVVLIAAALGVPTEVFREAFSGVTPAGLDRGPTAEEAQRNKAALMKVLAPYGITNDRLDEVSNYYRYNGRDGGIWKNTLAVATPVITDGTLTGITITNPGSGYSSPPTVTIKGPDGVVTAKVTVAYTKDFSTNGSISSIEIE